MTKSGRWLELLARVAVVAVALGTVGCKPPPVKPTLEQEVEEKALKVYSGDGAAALTALIARAQTDPSYQQELAALDSALDGLIGPQNQSTSPLELDGGESVGQLLAQLPAVVGQIDSTLQPVVGDIYHGGQEGLMWLGLGFGDGLVGGPAGQLGVAAGLAGDITVSLGIGPETSYDFRHLTRGHVWSGQVGANISVSTGEGGAGCGGISAENYVDWICGISDHGLFPDAGTSLQPSVSVGASIGVGVLGKLAAIGGVNGGVDLGYSLGIEPGNLADFDPFCTGSLSLPSQVCGPFGLSGASGLTIGVGLEVGGCGGGEVEGPVDVSLGGAVSASCRATLGENFIASAGVLGPPTAGINMAVDLMSAGRYPLLGANPVATDNHLVAAGLALVYGLAHTDTPTPAGWNSFAECGVPDLSTAQINGCFPATADAGSAGPGDAGAPCGTDGAPCCPGGQCTGSGLICLNGRCGTCGIQGDPCCDGGQTCAANLTCSNNACESCGYAGLACCKSTPACNVDLTCVSDVCEADAGADDAGTVSASCISQNCPSGCCSGTTCEAGNSDAACGTGGVACLSCTGSDTCQNGQCAAPPTCTSQNCPSGCCSGNVCEAGSSNSACGTGGAACQSCTGSDTCQNGQCAAPPPTCTSQNCPSGCCSGSVCEAGSSSSACGTGGAACQTCSGGDACQSGQCAAPPASCSLPWGGNISDGASVTAYQASSVACGSSCASESRTCSSGTLSGSYANSACTVQSCPACGASGEACCSGSCNSGLTCWNSACCAWTAISPASTMSLASQTFSFNACGSCDLVITPVGQPGGAYVCVDQGVGGGSMTHYTGGGGVGERGPFVCPNAPGLVSGQQYDWFLVNSTTGAQLSNRITITVN